MRALDTALDLAIVPGYSRIGYGLRRATWPAGGRIDRDLQGRTVAITGATAGLGRAAAQGFAALGARVVLLVRDTAKGERVSSEIGGDVSIVECDLSDLTSVAAAVAMLHEQFGELHVLVNNAGVLSTQRTETPSGIELTFATNVLGTFALTEGVIDLLRAGAPSRVINVSSGGMYSARLDLDDLQTERGAYDGTRAYARTKRAEVVLTEVWAQRLAADGIVVHSMHPGWADTEGVRTSLPRFRTLLRPILRTPQEGADTIVWLGAADAPGRSTGLFWHDRRPRPTHRVPWTREAPGDAQRLYDLCAAATSQPPRARSASRAHGQR